MGTALYVCECAGITKCTCWRKSKALFPMRVIIPGWGEGWSQTGLPVPEGIFLSYCGTAHGWPGLPQCVCACVREAKREMDVNMERTRQILNRCFNIILCDLAIYFYMLSLYKNCVRIIQEQIVLRKYVWLWSETCGGKRVAIIKTFTFFSEDQILSHRQQNAETYCSAAHS